MCLKPARVGIVAAKALDGFNTIDQTGRDRTLQDTGEVLYKETANIDSKADIYSLGIILVEVVKCVFGRMNYNRLAASSSR